MSRPFQAHRKFQSTSALAVLASSSASAKGRDERRKDQRKHGLERVEEGDGNAGLSELPGLSTPGSSCDCVRTAESSRSKGRGRAPLPMSRTGSGSSTKGVGVEDVRGWLSDVSAIRSPPSKRLSALMSLEGCLVKSCVGESSKTGFGLNDLLDLEVHRPLLSLLTRHATALAQRASSQDHSALSPGDDLAAELIPEMVLVVEMLQGLCLLSSKAKEACGEDWAVEMYIDLLLLLRTQAIPKDPTAPAPSKPIAYLLLELVCAVLVDSPDNARTFERLGGLEAVTRVLKGTGVVKDVRMKCIEFLYFYLLPENSAPQRSTSSRSSDSSASTTTSASKSSSSSGESTLYPPSPLHSSTSSTLSRASRKRHPAFIPRSPTEDMFGKSSDGRRNQSAKQEAVPEWKDLDMPFAPQTPRKPPQPSLGYLTPSTRRVSGGSMSTPGLATVPGSPAEVLAPSRENAISFRGISGADLADTLRRGSLAPELASDAVRRGSQDPDVGLGLGLPKTPGTVLPPTIKRDVTAIHLGPPKPELALDPFKAPHSPSSRNLVPHPSDSPRSVDLDLPLSPRSAAPPQTPRGLVKSSTQPSLTILQTSRPSPLPPSASKSSPVMPSSPAFAASTHQALPRSGSSRHVSVRRASKSPLAQSIIAEVPSPDASERKEDGRTQPQLPKPPKIRHSRTGSNLAGMLSSDEGLSSRHREKEEIPRMPKVRHSTTQLDLASLAPPQLGYEAGARSPRSRHSRTQSHLSGLPSGTGSSLVPPVPPLPALSSCLESVKSPAAPLPPVSPRPASTSLTKPTEPLGLTSLSSRPASTSADELTHTSSPIDRTASRARRAFPAELTRGLPPSASSPALSGALMPSRRVSAERSGIGGGRGRVGCESAENEGSGNFRSGSGERFKERVGKAGSGGEATKPRDYVRQKTETRGEDERDRAVGRDGRAEAGLGRAQVGLGQAGRQKAVRSVEEKKQMLGAWLGNVDALVQGVEKVSFWGTAGKRERYRD